MASFDQNVPQIAPDPLSYTRLFHPIDTPKPDESKATLIKGVTDSLETGIASADQALKTHAEFLGEQMGEKEQSDYLSNVQLAANVTGNKDGGGPQTPSQITNGLEFLQRNKDAYDQGKLRETEYLRNLYEKAKALRQQWPSYRDQIDRGVEKATGITPNANALIKSLLQDINDRKSKEDKVKEKIVNDAITQASQGNQSAYQAYQNYQNDGDHNKLLGVLTKSNALEWAAKDARSGLEITQAGATMNQIPATRIISDDYSKQSQLLWETFKPNIPGLDKDTTMEQLLLNRQEGKGTQLSDDQWQQLGQQWDAAVTRMNADRNKFYNTVDPKSKQSLRMMAGDKFDDSIKNAGSLLTDIRKNITDKDLGGMANTEVANKIQNAQDTQKVRQDPGIGPMMGILQGLKQSGGEQFVGQIWSQLSGQFADSFSKLNLTLLASKLASPQHYSISRAVDSMADAAKDGRGEVDPNQIRALVKDIPVTTITRPDVSDQIKRNVVLNTFGPDNEGLLAKIPSNATVGNREVQGRQSVYEAYTSPKMIAEVKRLADEGHPRLWEYFKQWNINEFTTDLFGDDVNRLSQLQKQPNFELHFQDGAGTSPPKFIAFTKYRANTSAGPTVPVSKDLQQTVDNVNKAVIGLYNVYSAEGGSSADVKAHMIQVFQANGINPNVGDSVARQMLISVGTKKQEKDQSKAKQNE